jgi:hypothetical protein
VHKIYPSDNREMSLVITIKCNGKKRFRVWSEEYQRINSKYADRIVEVDGKRTIFFSFPVTPKNLFIGCKNADNINDSDFEVEIIETPLRKYNIFLDAEAMSFLQFAIKFSQTCGWQTPEMQGTVYKSDDGRFRIKYFPIIIDRASGKAINTPARIGHNTGIIEVSKKRFDKYTIPMRITILLHEFSHKYRNPKINLPISNEFGADINALYLYLGVGFSKIDGITVFAKVFLKAQTDSNIQRMRKIQDYIQRFENQEYAQVI